MWREELDVNYKAIDLTLNLEVASFTSIHCFLPLPYCSLHQPMPKTRELSVVERGKMVGMKEQGASNKAIAAALKCSTSTVQRLLRKNRDIGTLENLPRPGRPPIFKARDVRQLTRVVHKD